MNKFSVLEKIWQVAEYVSAEGIEPEAPQNCAI
jgi:hypothetical protein